MTSSFKSTINTGLPNLPNPPDPAFMAEFIRVYNAIRNLAVAVDGYTGAIAQDAQFYSQTPVTQSVLVQNMQRVYVYATQALAYGQIVNLYNNGGTLGARLSNGASSIPAHAWCSTAGGVATNNWCEVMIGGLCTAYGGLTPGQTYYISNAAGSISSTVGTLAQKLGYALSPTALFFRPDLI